MKERTLRARVRLSDKSMSLAFAGLWFESPAFTLTPIHKKYIPVALVASRKPTKGHYPIVQPEKLRGKVLFRDGGDSSKQEFFCVALALLVPVL